MYQQPLGHDASCKGPACHTSCALHMHAQYADPTPPPPNHTQSQCKQLCHPHPHPPRPPPPPPPPITYLGLDACCECLPGHTCCALHVLIAGVGAGANQACLELRRPAVLPVVVRWVGGWGGGGGGVCTKESVTAETGTEQEPIRPAFSSAGQEFCLCVVEGCVQGGGGGRGHEGGGSDGDKDR
jgi:hypothetical protein